MSATTGSHNAHLTTNVRMPRIHRIATAALLAAGCGVAGLAAAAGPAAEYGTVVSSTPVTAQTAVPVQDCRDEQALVQPRNSGGGALLGALIGGAIGNSVGGGFGRAAATGLGVVAGAAVGDNVEATNNPPQATTVRRCQTVSRSETRLVGYDVVYDYRGQRYSTRLAQDPGDRIPLDVQVTPAGALAAAPLQQAQPLLDSAQPAVVYQQAPAAVPVYPAYPAYGAYPVYPAAYPGYYPYGGARVVIGVGNGYGGYGGRWHHGPGWR